VNTTAGIAVNTTGGIVVNSTAESMAFTVIKDTGITEAMVDTIVTAIVTLKKSINFII